MRLLLIEEDPRRCALIQHHLTSWKPDVGVVLHSPRLQGTLAPGFLAQGFDAVLLSRLWAGGRGLDWVRDLAGRTGFAPVVLLSEYSDDADARRALELGAEAVIGRDELDSPRFFGILDAAAERQARARTA